MSKTLPPARILIHVGGIFGLSPANFIQNEWSLDERISKRPINITILTENLFLHTTRTNRL